MEMLLFISLVVIVATLFFVGLFFVVIEGVDAMLQGKQ